MDNGYISVIVPFRNEGQYIERCAKSLLTQDFDKGQYEIIFVDNGSTDKAREIVSQFKDIVLLEEIEGNDYAARNKALMIAKGEIMAFIDGDCVASRHWLSSICGGMREDIILLALGKRAFPKNTPLILRLLQDYDNIKTEYVLRFSKEQYYFGYTNNMAVRSVVFKEIGCFTDRFKAGDTEFVHRFLSHYPKERTTYLDGMSITHLEISRLKTWYEKHRVYGRVNKTIEKSYRYRELRFIDRMRILYYWRKKPNAGLWRIIFICIFLAIGLVCYKIGKLRAVLRP